MKRSEKYTEFYRYKNNKCIKVLVYLRYYTIVINNPVKNKIRTIKCGESIINDIDLHELFNIMPENSNLENVLVYKNNAFFYFSNFGYLKIKINNLVNKKKSRMKNKWKLILEERCGNPISEIPNNFDRLINTGYKSFALFKSNLDIPYWNVLTVTNGSKIVDIDLYKFLLKLGISVDYNAVGLALDKENELVYMKLKNESGNLIYIYSDLNSNCTEYYDWYIVSNEIGDNTMDEKEKEFEESSEIKENIDFELKPEEEFDDKENDVTEESNENDESDREEYFRRREEENRRYYEEKEMIISKLDEFIETDAYSNNEVPTAKQFVENKTFDDVYYDDFNNACGAIFSKKVKEIKDPMFRNYVASDLGNKAFDAFKNMLYIAEIFTKNNPFKYIANEKSFEIKGFSAYDAFYDENNRSRISFGISLNPLNDRDNNPGLEIRLNVFVEFSYMNTETKEIKKRSIPIGIVITNVRPIYKYCDMRDKYMVTVCEDNGNLFDYAKTITYIDQSAGTRCLNCDNIGKDCCLRVGGQLRNSEVNLTIENGCIPVSEKVIDFLKSSKKLTNDIFATCTILSERD